MPRSKSQKPKDPWAAKFEFMGFVRCVMTDARKAQYASWDLGVDECLIEIAGLLGEYKFSLSRKDEHSYIATLTCMAPYKPAFGYALSGFAGDWESAIRVLWFKHTVLLEGDWLENQSPPSEGGGIG